MSGGGPIAEQHAAPSESRPRLFGAMRGLRPGQSSEVNPGFRPPFWAPLQSRTEDTVSGKGWAHSRTERPVGRICAFSTC